MSGLSSIGLYLPRHQIARDDRAVAAANGDEDAFTMAVEAAHRCLEEVEPLTFGGLFFASVTSPYREAQLASAIATACDLPRDIVTADFGGSPRAGLSALISAVRAVDGGVRKVLVVAADCRLGGHGDGAVAAVVDSKASLCGFLATAAVAEDVTFQGAAERVEDEAARSLRDLAEVVERVINEYGVGADQLSALALGGSEEEGAVRLAEMVGIDPNAHLVSSHVAEVGALGSPEALFQLAVALERAEQGDRIVVASNGEGAEAVLFEAMAGAGAGRPAVRAILDRQLPPSSPTDASVGPLVWDESFRAEPADERSLQQTTRLYGTRCAACHAVQFPQAAECSACGTKDGLEPAKLRKCGHVTSVDPSTGAAMVELQDGGCLQVAITDTASAAVSPGGEVRLTLRRNSPGAAARYTWKARLP
ncbi:MAG: hypothetical protein P8R42_15150 [Candidatus Binatia bacterium]|nr:hypothetical protein [Candidatus Binatia bacterium]